MSNKRLLLKILAVMGIAVLCAGGGLLVIQLIPVNHTNPPLVNEPAWDSPQTRGLMERACFDCHSNETTWPWYSNIAPISWVISHNVDEGRHKINYSNWRSNQENESLEVLLKGEMPPNDYLLLHPEARLTQAETKDLIAGLEATFGDNLK